MHAIESLHCNILHFSLSQNSFSFLKIKKMMNKIFKDSILTYSKNIYFN